MSKAKYSRRIVSKWRKTYALLKKQDLRSYIPPTRIMTHSSLRELLNRYGMVYIKPDCGTYGNGVFRVESYPGNSEAPYRYQAGMDIHSFKSYDEMYNSIIKRIGKRRYLVQKGIHLTKYRGRRFDIRVMVQQSPDKRWETTGVIGRVAHPRKIVTNIHNGGVIRPIETLLASYLPGHRKEKYINRLRKLGLRTAHQLHSHFPGLKEIGLDVALDQKLHPWVLEVNTSPDPFIFKRLKDKRIFGRIYRYARAYRGR